MQSEQKIIKFADVQSYFTALENGKKRCITCGRCLKACSMRGHLVTHNIFVGPYFYFDSKFADFCVENRHIQIFNRCCWKCLHCHKKFASIHSSAKKHLLMVHGIHIRKKKIGCGFEEVRVPSAVTSRVKKNQHKKFGHIRECADSNKAICSYCDKCMLRASLKRHLAVFHLVDITKKIEEQDFANLRKVTNVYCARLASQARLQRIAMLPISPVSLPKTTGHALPLPRLAQPRNVYSGAAVSIRLHLLASVISTISAGKKRDRQDWNKIKKVSSPNGEPEFPSPLAKRRKLH